MAGVRAKKAHANAARRELQRSALPFLLVRTGWKHAPVVRLLISALR